MKKVGFILIIVFLLSISIVSAHLPRLVYNLDLNKDPWIIKNPEISQAFYGNLKGIPDYYIINSDKEFELYVGILSPDINRADKDFSVEIYSKEGNYTLNGLNFTWKSFYEEFGGDNYFSGPEIDKNVSAGEYIIKVYSPDNQGKYSLAIGKIESFTFSETIKTYIKLPLMKSQFFEKSPLTAYFNILGIFLLVMIVSIVVIVLILRWIIKKVMKKNKKR